MQVSDRKASVAMGAATKTMAGAAVVSTVMGAVGTFGTASTGTAIAGLAGAAKTTATLYWIGGLVGGGVAAGTFVLGAGAVGAGIYGSIKVRRAILGLSRKDSLSDREERIVMAIHALVQSISSVKERGQQITAKEMALFSRLGVTPLLDELRSAMDDGTLAELKAYHRTRLRGHLFHLRGLLKKLEHA